MCEMATTIQKGRLNRRELSVAVNLPIAKVLAICDPLNAWDAGPVTREMIDEAIQNRWWSPSPVGHGASPKVNATRIAFLVENGWGDAIEIDVGVPGYMEYVWPVRDGNHRLAAASIRGDKFILATVEGSLNYAQELFGVDCEECAYALGIR